MPWSVLMSLVPSVTSGLSAPGELARSVQELISGLAAGGSGASIMPTMIDLELFFRSPSPTQLEAATIVLSWLAWLLWLWLLGTTALRIVVVLGERTIAGAQWPTRLRAVSDRITLALVRRAVDATLASEM